MKCLLACGVFAVAAGCDTSGRPAGDTAPSAASEAAAARPDAGVDSAQVAEEIVRLEREWAAAIQRKDTAAMARLKADNFVYVAPDGRIYDKPGSQADVVGDTTTYTSMSIENPRVWVYGDVAVIVANSTDESTGPRGPVRNRYTFTDVWVRQGGSWKVVNDHVSRITTK